MKLSVLITTYNRHGTTAKYLPAILNKIGEIECECLIWDNYSKDGTLDWLCELSKLYHMPVHIFGGTENLGMEAFNYMAEEAKGEFLLKVDDDITVPRDFGRRLVETYTRVDDPKLAYLAWDMKWSKGSFATRSGMELYKAPHGRIVNLGKNEIVLIHYSPGRWMVNGVCRLSRKDTFLALGGHPKGFKYGVDHRVSIAAQKAGYHTGFLCCPEKVIHFGNNESTEYRTMKNSELRKQGAPLNV
jgi:GT2 family glycosyltransferase